MPEADDPQSVTEILNYYVRQFLEDLDGDDLPSREHSRKWHASDDQIDMLGNIIDDVWSELQWCSTSST